MWQAWWILNWISHLLSNLSRFYFSFGMHDCEKSQYTSRNWNTDTPEWIWKHTSPFITSTSYLHSASHCIRLDLSEGFGGKGIIHWCLKQVKLWRYFNIVFLLADIEQILDWSITPASLYFLGPWIFYMTWHRKSKILLYLLADAGDLATITAFL